MKLTYPRLLIGCFLISIIAIAPKAFSQTRQVDGSIIYKDGSRRLPNGTIVYPDGTNSNNKDKRWVDGIFHPTKKNPVYTSRYPGSNNNGRRLPPGQAKKIYGGEAKDYAHGHNKGKGKWNKHEDGDNDRDNNEGKGHHGKDKDD